MSRIREAVFRSVGHWPVLVAGACVLAAGSPRLAILWFGAGRLAYVLFVGLALRAESRRGSLPGRDSAWGRFSVRAAWLMDNDAVAFAVLCLSSAGTLPRGVSWTVSIAGGTALVAAGIGIKVWAAATLPAGSYTWRDFFLAPEPRPLVAEGPYRWLSHPMYTLGYAHAYGLALALRSPAGLAAAAFAQASILLLHALVERPHLLRLRARGDAFASVGIRPIERPGHPEYRRSADRPVAGGAVVRRQGSEARPS